MTKPLPPLLGLQAFEVSARRLSFVAAADELHLSASAVSQRVKVLERHLGEQLFERLARSLRLTPAGEAYLPAVRAVFEDLAAATSGVFGHRERASVTIRAQASYAATWLAPRLPDFSARFPHVDVRLITSIWVDTLSPSQIDLEIRQGSGSWPGYRALRLHDDSAVAVYGPAYVARHGPEPATALAGRPRVQVLGFDDLWRRFFATAPGAAPGSGEPPAVITVDTSLAALEIVARGELWTIVPERFARRAVREGRVHQVPGPVIAMRQGHYLLSRDDDAADSPETRAFTTWLGEQDAEDPPLVDLA